MSLDQIIANKPKPVKQKKVVPAKAQRAAKPAQKNQPKIKQPNGKDKRVGAESIFNRLGSQQHLVFFSNLHKNISANDISELAGAHGDVERVTMKSNGIVVAFGNKNHSHACVKSLNGVTLDNRPMIVKHGNGESAIAGSKTVAVKPFVANNGGRKVDRNNRPNNRDSNQGGRGGDRGKPQGGRGGARVEKPKRPVTVEELDKQMDVYMDAKKLAPKTPEELDAEMDAYMAAKKE